MSAQKRSAERRKYRRISDAVALQLNPLDEAANDQGFKAEELPDHPTHVVSLSPNGLKCFHSEPFNTGDVLQLSFRVFPSGQRIDTKVSVVNSGEDESTRKNDRFFAGLAFKGISAEQKSYLLQHIEGVVRQSFGGSVKLVNR